MVDQIDPKEQNKVDKISFIVILQFNNILAPLIEGTKAYFEYKCVYNYISHDPQQRSSNAV